MIEKTVHVHPIPLRVACAYLITSDDGTVLVDAGAPRQERTILQYLAQFGGGDLRLIFITHAHFDHYGSAAAIRRATGAPIAVHEADRDPMARGETPIGTARGYGRLTFLLAPLIDRWFQPEPTEADVVLEDGEDLTRFGIPGRVVHTPGHTFGSSTLLLDDGTAFVGDLVATVVRPRLQHLYAQDWDLLQRSLERLAELAPKRVYPGHGRRPLDGSTFQRLVANRNGARR
ncbi:MAG TPA: MBL fold metallo-hydrolase [Thermoflexia bacterium]|jgi:glyoxylase-like metal-dependent hydrolase (beta-lactamase superfamily II)|nr:MBL fold metallo-hydrolase [Thermoflexia bacterium]